MSGRRPADKVPGDRYDTGRKASRPLEGHGEHHMDSSESEHRPRRPRKAGRPPPSLPSAGGHLIFACELRGGPYDGLTIMVALPLPDELDLSQYVGGPAAKKHFYRRGRATAAGCEYAHARSEDVPMFQSGDERGPAARPA